MCNVTRLHRDSFLYIVLFFLIISEASRYLVEVLAPVDDEDRNEWLDKIIEIVQKQPCKFTQEG